MNKHDPLTGYDEADKERIKTLAARFVISQIERGEIPATDDAIRAAMPVAVRTAKRTINAVWEFLS